jgi:predicted GNAT family acetyltransferase
VKGAQMTTNSVKINEVDVSKEKIRSELIDYLEPRETQALFLLGNMLNRCYPSVMYVARQDEKIAGMCGYWPTFQSCSIFCENHEVAKSLARTMLQNHPSVKTVLGMADMVKPAYDEFIASGRRSIGDPEMLFFELTIENCIPIVPSNGVVRRMTEYDVDEVVRLNRILHQIPSDAPITEEERIKVRATPSTVCLEIDGRIVSVASSNGRAIQSFQILGVATDPAYRRRGYAKMVCSALICSMREQGATKAIIFTGKENVAATNCYLGLGFKITDRYYVAQFNDRELVC